MFYIIQRRTLHMKPKRNRTKIKYVYKYAYKSGTWQRATISKWSAKISTSLPIPSSPHWNPNTSDTWFNDPIRLSDSLATDSTTLKEEEAASFKVQTTKLRWWCWKWRLDLWGVHLEVATGLGSRARDEKFMVK